MGMNTAQLWQDLTMLSFGELSDLMVTVELTNGQLL
jgi:hypothetical protein